MLQIHKLTEETFLVEGNGYIYGFIKHIFAEVDLNGSTVQKPVWQPLSLDGVDVGPQPLNSFKNAKFYLQTHICEQYPQTIP